MKENPAPLLVATPPTRPAPTPQERQPNISLGPTQIPELPAESSNGIDNISVQEAEGIFVTC